MIAIVGWYIVRHRGQLVLQLHALITVSYLNIFPMLDYLFSDGLGMESFGSYQWLVVMFFQLPLLLATHAAAGRRPPRPPVHAREPAALSPLLPWLLVAVLASFWYVALNYNLFFRRLGHAGLQHNTAEVPGALLYIYRASVESAFFVIIFLCATLDRVAPQSRYLARYRLTLIAYAGSYALFFLVNSRMQFVLLLLCIVCTQPRIADYLTRRVNLPSFVLLLVLLVLGLTLLREIVLEDNNRVDTGDIGELLRTAGWLIAARLDSVYILNVLDTTGFNVWGFDMTGISKVIELYMSYFTDPATYNAIKESLITSPSVAVVNRLLSSSDIDFPKSMILDMFLTFGTLGLLTTAILLGTMIGRVQRRLICFRGFNLTFLVSLYALPMLLEFEKEFIGFLVSFLKWIPALLLCYWLRPRFPKTRAAKRGLCSPAPQLA
jgi:hypothetical protein